MRNFSSVDRSYLAKKAVIILIVFLSFHFIADILDKLVKVYGIEIFKANRYLKLLFLGIIAMISLVYYYTKISTLAKNWKTVLVVCVILLYFIKSYYFNFFETFFRYLFWLILIPFFYFLKQCGDAQYFIDKVYLLFKYVIIINVLAVLIGLVSNEQFFLTYYARFGYSGILLNQMQLPYFYLAALFVFCNKNKMIFVFITILLSLLSGVKSIYLGIVLFFVFKWFYFDANRFLFITKLKLSIAIILVFSIFLFFLFRTQLFSFVIDKYGIISAIFSLRDLNLVNLLNEINTDNFSVFIGAIGDIPYRTEFGFFDVFFFFGLIGFIFYAWLLKKIFISFVNNKLALSYFIINFIIVAFAGNFFYFPINCLFFSVTLLFLNKNLVNESTSVKKV